MKHLTLYACGLAVLGVGIGLLVFWHRGLPGTSYFYQQGNSMLPTYPGGTCYVVSYPKSSYTSGEAVVVQNPQTPTATFIKRIIALPGQTVLLSSGRVYVNGKVLDETAYLYPKSQTYGDRDGYIQDGQAKTLPDNSYFVLGDDRESSADSRLWGPEPLGQIKGAVGQKTQLSNCGVYR